MIYENLFNTLNYERDIVKCCREILKIFEKKNVLVETSNCYSLNAENIGIYIKNNFVPLLSPVM